MPNAHCRMGYGCPFPTPGPSRDTASARSGISSGGVIVAYFHHFYHNFTPTGLWRGDWNITVFIAM